MNKTSISCWVASAAAVVSVAMTGAFASVPKAGTISNDTALYQNLSEIKVARELSPNFDADIARLSQLEPRYSERLPSLTQQNSRLAAPIQRVSQQKYRYASPQPGKRSQSRLR